MRRRRIPTSPPPTCASATAIRPRTGWLAPGPLLGSRPAIPNRSLTVGRAALEAHDRAAARAAIAPLIASDSPHGRPTRRVCLLMADIEEAEGHQGAVREWLGRAARAPRDKAWVADGVISDRWAPVSPSGTLDAFVWRTPDERIAAPGGARGRPTPAPAAEAVAAPAPAPRSRRPRRPSSPSAAPRPLKLPPSFSRRAGRHHRSCDDAARRPRPGGAGNETARLPALRQ